MLKSALFQELSSFFLVPLPPSLSSIYFHHISPLLYRKLHLGIMNKTKTYLRKRKGHFMNPIAFTIGGLEVRWYGILIAAAMIIAMVITYRRSPQPQHLL